MKFVEEFKTVTGTTASSSYMFYYLGLLTAVEAIKLAGSDDPVDINDAIHSGNLEFDTPVGIAHFTTEGESGLDYGLVQVQEDGTLVPVE